MPTRWNIQHARTRRKFEIKNNEINFLLAVLAILQPANTASLWPWCFLHLHLHWRGFAVPRYGVGTSRVRTCLWTLLWKWKHGTSHNGMASLLCSARWQCHRNTWKTAAVLWRWCLSLAHNVFWRLNPYKDEQHSGWPSTTQRGDNTAWVRELVRSDRSLTVRMFADEVNMNRETGPAFDTDWIIGDEKNLCQDGTQESHRATEGCAIERSFCRPNALWRCCSLLTHLISQLATSFYFKK